MFGPSNFTLSVLQNTGQAKLSDLVKGGGTPLSAANSHEG